MEGADIGRTEASGGVTVIGEGFGTSSWNADVEVRLDSVTTGKTVTAPTWRDNADACFDSVAPAEVRVEWAFDTTPLRSRELARSGWE